MFKGPIEKRVMAAVKGRILKAEQEFKKECILLEQACEVGIKKLKSDHEVSKGVLADKLVNNVFTVK